MCCLFGLIDHNNCFTGRQRTRLLSILAAECETRGTDAAGVAYNSNSGLHIYKRPFPAHKLRLNIPNDAGAVMGHTRMTTQGSEARNYNNHPFLGRAGRLKFALAHNGVLHNDRMLRFSLTLPNTRIETDSYIAVQLIESRKALNFSSLKYMAEQIEGSFTFTVLDAQNNWYLVKGDNPMCLYFFPQSGFYLYASTEEILSNALRRMNLGAEKPRRIKTNCGDILCIGSDSRMTHSTFDTSSFFESWPLIMQHGHSKRRTRRTRTPFEQEYLEELKAVAASFGYRPDYIDEALNSGITLDDAADLLYCGYL